MINIRTSNTILYCIKWHATVEFYKTKLRLPVVSVRDWFIEFKLNDASFLSIADAAKTSIDSGDGKGITITMQVDDIEAAHIYLSGAGVDPTPIMDHAWGARAIHIYDPEGNRLEFWSPMKAVPVPVSGLA